MTLSMYSWSTTPMSTSYSTSLCFTGKQIDVVHKLVKHCSGAFGHCFFLLKISGSSYVLLFQRASHDRIVFDNCDSGSLRRLHDGLGALVWPSRWRRGSSVVERA